MKFGVDEILIVIIAFLIGWFLRTIIKSGLVEGVIPDRCFEMMNEQCISVRGLPQLCGGCMEEYAGSFLKEGDCLVKDIHEYCGTPP